MRKSICSPHSRSWSALFNFHRKLHTTTISKKDGNTHTMGNEISTIGGGAVTVGAAVLAGVTLGQVQSLNDVVVDSATFTLDKAKKTVVRHVGEAVVMGTATVGAGVASAITFGQVQALNDATVSCASQTAQASYCAGAEAVSIADGVTNAIPVVGHIKGVGLYAAGYNERGEQAMKGASRSVGVVAGGIGGFIVGGPPGAVAGGMAGGALMDGVITGADTAVHGEYRPHGQVSSWTKVVTAKNGKEFVQGLVGVATAPVLDGLAGFGAGTGAEGLDANTVDPDAAGFDNGLYDVGMDSFEPELDGELLHDELDDQNLSGVAMLVGFVDAKAEISVDTVRGRDIEITPELLVDFAVKTNCIGEAWTKISPKRIRAIIAIGYKKRTRHLNPAFAPLMPGALVADGVVELTIPSKYLPAAATPC